MATFSAVAKFSAQDRFSGVMKRMQGSSERFAASSQTSFRKVEASATRLKKRISGIGSQLKTLVAFGGITGILLTGANAITEYDTAMASLQSITGATNTEMVAFDTTINKVAKDTKIFSGDVAKAFELVGSAKPELLTSAEALGEVSKQALILSKAGKLQTADAVTALTVSLNQFGAGADKAAQFTDILATAQQKGSGPVGFLAQAMVKAGGISKAFGNSFEDTVAVLEGFAKAGVPATEAGTQYAGIMSKLAKVSQKEFNPQFTKATDIIDNLTKANLSYTELLKLTDSEGARWITTIVNQNKIVQDLAGNLHDVGNAQAQAAINTATIAERFKQLTDSFKNATAAQSNNSTGLKLLNKLLVVLANNMDWIIGLIAGLAAVLIPMVAVYKAVQGVTWLYNAALAANAIIAGKGAIALKGNIAALKIYGSISKVATAAQWAWNAAMTANPIGLIIAAIVAVIAVIVLLVKHWDTIKQKFLQAPTWVKIALMPFIIALSPLLMLVHVIRKIVDAWGGIKAAFSDGGFIAGMKKLGGVILSALIDPLVFFLKLLAKIPGMDSKINPLVARIEEFQLKSEGGFGVDDQLAANNQAPINTAATENRVREEQIKRSEQNVNINVNDPNGRTSVNPGNGPVPVKVNSTTSNFE